MNEKARQHQLRKLFPENESNCFECNIKLTNSNRRRMVSGFEGHGMTIMTGYTLCKKCAARLKAQKYHLVPRCARDMGQVLAELEGGA